MRRKPIVHTVGSDNVFADLGFSDARERLLKASIVIEIDRLVKAYGLTQTAAAARLGISQPDLSHLLRGRTDRYSTERLIEMLTALGQDIEIVARAGTADRETGRISFRAEP